MTEPEKKKILIFSLAYYPVVGGAEIAVKEITNRIKDVDFDMVTMSFDDNHQNIEKVGNVEVHRIKSTKTTFPMDAYLYAKNLHIKNNYDAIWAIMAARAGAAALFFKFSFPGVPYVLTLQEGDPVWYMKLRSLYYINPFFRKIFSKANKVQAISHYLADYAQAMGYLGEVNVIPNGVDVKNFSKDTGNRNEIRNNLYLQNEDIVLITTSRLVTKNRTGDIIESLKFLPAEIKLIVIGEGKLEKKLKATTEKLGLVGRVKFLGHVPYEEIPQYLHASDIFVRPSISEGFGNSFIEAMAAGLPVIATEVGGIPDFLEDRETGLFAEVKNPKSIAKQVKKLLENTALISHITANASKMVKDKYTWDLVASEMSSKVLNI